MKRKRPTLTVITTIRSNGFLEGAHLGVSGACGDVAFYHKGGKRYVGKRVTYRSMFQQEVSIMKKVPPSPYVLRLVHEDAAHRLIITQYCDRGDLLSLVAHEHGHLRPQMHQLVQAINVLQASLIVHRDLKPDNIFVTRDKTIKVGDFGLSVQLSHQDEHMSEKVGTAVYQAPEVRACSKYQRYVDVWALGVLLFIMSVGYHPFDPDATKSKKDTMHAIQTTDVPTKDLAPGLKDIVHGLTHRDPLKRWNVERVSSHVYFKE